MKSKHGQKPRRTFNHGKIRTRIEKDHAMRCPAPCTKIRCFSEQEAWDVAYSIYHTRGGEPPKRVYECEDAPGVWHWTRREAWDEKRAD